MNEKPRVPVDHYIFYAFITLFVVYDVLPSGKGYGDGMVCKGWEGLTYVDGIASEGWSF